MNWRLWFKSLAAAVIGGAASAGLLVYADPQHFNFSHDGLVALGKLAGGGAILALLAYLKQSPLPNGPKQ